MLTLSPQPAAPARPTTLRAPYPAPDPPSPREVHRLHHVLVRERSRIDRAGGVMSLVVFHVPSRVWIGKRRINQLIETLKERLRITDEVGMIDGRRAFALLPDTDAFGAEVLARQIQRRLLSEGLATNFAVFRYASSRSPVSAVTAEGPDDSGPSGRSFTGPVSDPTQTDAESAPLRIASVRTNLPMNVDDSAPCLVSNFADTLPWWKRAIDLTVASTALFVASPIMLGTALAIRLEDPGPVLFRQQRMGAGRRPFGMFKFRTMVVDAEKKRNELLALNEQDGPAFKISDDPRVTRVGKFLRATSIDELPQLFNVLRGEMTLVGPRPLPVFEAEACENWHDARHSVHPGLTCIWQVEGRSRVSFDDWARMDLRYTRSRTFWHDLKILFATVPAVVKREGAS